MSIEINNHCELMQTYIQSRFDLLSHNGGIIGVTYNKDKDVFDIYYNTDRVSSHRKRDLPLDEAQLKEFLSSVARSISSIANFPKGEQPPWA